MGKNLLAKASMVLGPRTVPVAKPAITPGSIVEKPKTAIGAMAQFTDRQSTAIKEVESLRDQLKEHEGSRPTKLLDPKLIVRSKWANRHDLSFKDKDFAELKADIKVKGCNVQPIKVRPLKGRPGLYEVVFGHRRHQACLELEIDVLAMIEDLDEKSLFVEMDHENRQRKDLRPYEQGVMYARALDEGLFPSMRKLAEEVGVEAGTASKAIALARLPAEVLAAFVSPMDLQFRWASDLTQAIQKNPELVLSKARVFPGETPRVPSAQVYKILVGQGVSRGNAPSSGHRVVSGKTLLATIKEGKQGATTIDISVALNADDKKQLEVVLTDFLKKRLVKG